MSIRFPRNPVYVLSYKSYMDLLVINRFYKDQYLSYHNQWILWWHLLKGTVCFWKYKYDSMIVVKAHHTLKFTI